MQADLENKLIKTVDYWSHKVTKNKKWTVWSAERECSIEVHNPFYPRKHDLVPIVWTKLLKPSTQAKIENIWASSDPVNGGYRGVDRFVSVVVTNAMLDFKRRQDKRAQTEIFSASLETTVAVQGDDGFSEDTDTTLAETISDDEGLTSPFVFEDLADCLTPTEYNIFCEWTRNGPSIREIAEDTGRSKSDVGRIVKTATEKASAFVAELSSRTPAQVRANRYPVFTRASLRPNRISKENLECWNDSLKIVAEYDPEKDYRAPVHPSKRVRARRECINAACQHGFAVGKDNLILPAGRRHEAVRFLPAPTDSANSLCAGCARATHNIETCTTKPDAYEASANFLSPAMTEIFHEGAHAANA